MSNSNLKQECPICKKQVIKILMKKHLKYHQDKIIPTNYRKCDICDTPIHKSSFNRHLRGVHNYNPFLGVAETKSNEKTPAPKTKAPAPKTKAPAPKTKAPAPKTKAPAPAPAPAPKTKAPAPKSCEQGLIFNPVKRKELSVYNQNYRRLTGRVPKSTIVIERPRQPQVIINGECESKIDRARRLAKLRKEKFILKQREKNKGFTKPVVIEE